MKTEPFWWDAARPEATEIALPDGPSDVLIIGGGYTGLSAALTLAKRNLSVTVLDAEMPGFGASSRNGGMVGNLLKPGLTGLIGSYGVEKGCAIYKEALASVEFIAARIHEEGIECDLTLSGRFYPAILGKDLARMTRDFECRQRYLDVPEEMVSVDGYGEDVDSPGYKGGLRQHHTGGLHPAKYVKGLAAAAVRAGARVIAPLRAEAIAKTTEGFSVTTAKGELRAAALLIAMIVALGEAGVKQLDDLADLSGDELISAEDGILREFGLSADDANQVVMAARAHWFEDEENEADPEAEEEISAD